MSTSATRPAPKLSVISRALRRAIQFCERMAQASNNSQPQLTHANKWRAEAAEYQTLLAKIEPKRKETKKPA